MASEDYNKLTVSIKDGVSKKTGAAYVYVSIEVNSTELTRMFIKPTELDFFQTLEGTYSLVPEESSEVK